MLFLLTVKKTVMLDNNKNHVLGKTLFIFLRKHELILLKWSAETHTVRICATRPHSHYQRERERERERETQKNREKEIFR